MLNAAGPAFLLAAELKSDRNENASHDISCAAAFTNTIQSGTILSS